MGLEIERKFLVKHNSWKEKATLGQHIQQGYLNLDKERTVRVRVIAGKGMLTIKGKTVRTTRLEFEYEIPLDDALQLLNLCEQSILEKTRYLLDYEGNTWEIDVFEGVNEGLCIAEIELETEDQKVALPDWVGKEVSDDIRYYNSNLILHPFKDWE